MNGKRINKLHHNPFASIVIILLNCIPLAGLLFLKWETREIFLYYSLELTVYTACMVPEIIVFARKAGEDEGKSLFGTIMSVFFCLIYHAGFFLLIQSFLVHSAFAGSAGEGALFTVDDLAGFVTGKMIFVLMMMLEHCVGFYLSFIRNKEHKVLSCDFYAQEIYFAPMILLLGVGLVYGLSAGLRLEGFWHALAVVIVIAIAKSGTQKMQNDRRVRELRELREAEASGKTAP